MPDKEKSFLDEVLEQEQRLLKQRADDDAMRREIWEYLGDSKLATRGFECRAGEDGVSSLLFDGQRVFKVECLNGGITVSAASGEVFRYPEVSTARAYMGRLAAEAIIAARDEVDRRVAERDRAGR
jgi:hypothetical protein